MRKLKNEELGRLSEEEFKSAKKLPVVIVLDNIRSMNNIGSVFRTADSFSFQSVYLCGITAVPPHRDIEKTALGATKTVDWKYFQSTSEAVAELKEKGFSVLAVEQAEGSILLSELKLERREYAFVFGNEVSGVDQLVVNACDNVLEIPQSGTKHSLNIAVSVGVVGWESYRQLKFQEALRGL